MRAVIVPAAAKFKKFVNNILRNSSESALDDKLGVDVHL